MKNNAEDSYLVQTIFRELKHMGVKVPKAKKFKSGMPKQNKRSGKPKNKIFGVDLAEQEWVSCSEGVLPKFITDATMYLLEYSKEEGLFRKAGSVARQKTLRTKLENGEDFEGSNAYDVASLLKQWLRELPEPLIPHYMQDLFIRCQHLDNKDDCMTASLLASLLLPPGHLHTLKHLLCFLAKLAANSNENKMNAYNLALMMAPNIFFSGTEIADKNSNNLVPLQTSTIQLLIENADKIGEVPSSVSFHPLQEGKSGSELDSSTDLLDFSPSKSRKKRKSGQLQDILSGIKKLVGQNTAPGTSLKMTPEKHSNSRVNVPKSASKRKADPDQASPSIKRLATSVINSENGMNLTPKTKDNGNYDTDCKSGNRHSRRKSFGLLRRKERKRQKSSKSGCQVQLKPASTSSQNHSNVDATCREPAMQVSLKVNEHPEAQSPFHCSFEDFLNSVSLKKATSDCYLTPNLRRFSHSPKPTSISYSHLQDKLHVTSPYWLRSDKTETKDMSDNHKIEFVPFYNESKLSDKEKVEFKPTQIKGCSSGKTMLASGRSQFQVDSNLPQDNQIYCGNEMALMNEELAEFKEIESSSSKTFTARRSPRLKIDSNLNVSSITQKNPQVSIDATPKNKDPENTFTCSLLSDSVYDLNNSMRKRSFSTGTKLIRKAAITRQDAFILKSRNKGDILENEAKSSKNNGNKDSHFNESTLPSAKVNSNHVHKDTSVVSLSRKGSKQGSLIRGRPNSVKTGLLSQSLKNKSILSSLDVNETEKSANEIDLNEINLSVPFTQLIRDDVETHSELSSDQQDLSLIMKFGTFCIAPDIPSSASTLDMGSNSNEVSVSKSKVRSERKLRSSNDSFEKKQKPKQKSSLPICLDAPTDADRKISKQGSSFEIDRTRVISECEEKKVSEYTCGLDASGCFKMPAPSKETTFDISNLEISMNDSCFKTPKQNPSTSPSSITWVSGTKFLGFASPEEDNFNKRESIALILKNKSGHVQEKVNQYDNRIRDSVYCTRRVQSCSTPYIAFGTNQNSSHQMRSPSLPVQRRLQDSQKSHKSLSVSKSCDSTKKRNHVKSKLPKSPFLPPPKFVVEDLSTPSPKMNRSLKEVTNICLGLDESINSQNNSPRKNESTCLKQSPFNVDNDNECQKIRKLKRNSFSGHTPHTFTKRVTRSESSPCRPRSSKKLSVYVQESTTHRNQEN